MTFSPYQFELVLALLYLIAKTLYEIRLHKWKSELTICKSGISILITALRIINMALLICAMVGLSRTGYDGNGICSDSTFRTN
jgi:hypothetical protein